MKAMRFFLTAELIDRLFFTAIVIGILMVLAGAVRYVDLSGQLAANEAVQIHQSGEEVAVETNSQVRGLVAADLERRRLTEERFNMMVVVGVGLALIGLGWLATDIMRGRRRKARMCKTDTQSATEATS